MKHTRSCHSNVKWDRVVTSWQQAERLRKCDTLNENKENLQDSLMWSNVWTKFYKIIELPSQRSKGHKGLFFTFDKVSLAF